MAGWLTGVRGVSAALLLAGACLAPTQTLAQHPGIVSNRDFQARDYKFFEEPQPEKLVPKNPLTVEETKRIEARKLYTYGYSRLRKGRLEQAYELFKEALEYDPASITVLKEMVPLCERLQKSEEGLEYSRQALKLEPDNYALLQFYAQQMEQQGKLEAAIDALEAASKTEKLRDEDPVAFIAIRDKLAELHGRLGDHVGTAQALRDIVDIAEDPMKYGLDAMTRRQLIQQKVRLYERLGTALKEAKQYEEAVAVLKKGIDSQPGGRRLTQTLADVYYDMGDYPKALEQLEQYVGQTQSIDVFELYEKLLAKMDKSEELLPALEKLAERDRYNPVLAQFFAEKLIENKRLEEAEAQLEKIKDRPEAANTLAKLYREMGEPLKLLDTLAQNLRNAQTIAQIRTISQDPQLVKEIADAARDRGEGPQRFTADYVVAMASAEAGLVDQAKEFYERCISQRPDLSLLYRDLLDLLEKNRRYEDIVEVMGRAIEQRPQEVDFYEYKARALGMLERYDEAITLIQDFKGTLADRDALVNAEMVLAWIYQMQEEYEKAADSYVKVIEENPEQNRIPYARYMLSNIYTLKGDLKLAEEQLLLLVEGDDESVNAAIRAAANNDLGYIWADEGKNLERAQRMIETALELNEQMRRPPSAAYLDSMGWVLFKRGDYAGAVRYLKQATEAESGNDGVIWDHLGDAYLQIEDFERAQEAWEKAIELYKDDRREKERLKATQVEEKIRLLESGVEQAPEKATDDSP